MAYNCSSGCSRVNWWSNPNNTFNGQTMGTATTSDNSRVLNLTSSSVAGFRSEPSATQCLYTTDSYVHWEFDRYMGNTTGAWLYRWNSETIAFEQTNNMTQPPSEVVHNGYVYAYGDKKYNFSSRDEGLYIVNRWEICRTAL